MFRERVSFIKKRILADEYGMVMNAELEGRIKIMCNLSDAIEDRGFQKGISKERIDAIKRMITANITKEQITSIGYTEAEYTEAENSIYVNL